MRLDTRVATCDVGEALVEVAGCGICHTDLGFYYDGVPTRHPLPLILGHEVAGRVVEAGDGAEAWIGREVVVPAVIPCGECAACLAGRGPICPRQVFPGNDLHGGFASHLVVPSRGLCPVPDLDDPATNPAGLDLASLAVIADAVTTPYHAIVRSGLEAGDLAVFVGVGGVGGFGVQVAAAQGALVVAIDVDEGRLEKMGEVGAQLTLNASELDFRSLRGAVRGFAKEQGVPTWRQRIFECSGTPAGQASAFGLLGHGGYLAVVGYSPKKVEIRLSNLMALDATAQGHWGCPPELYPAVLDLVLQGDIVLGPFIEKRSMSSIHEAFDELHRGIVSRRLILIPES